MSSLDSTAKILKNHGKKASALLQILIEIQDIHEYLPMNEIKNVSTELQIPLTTIYGVISFYKIFRLHKGGETTIISCIGAACYTNGAYHLVNNIKQKLGVELGETSKDGKVSYQSVACMGYCANSPVVRVNNKVQAQITSDKLNHILSDQNIGSQDYNVQKSQIPIYYKQEKRILRNCGNINPEKIDDYLDEKIGGYSALKAALNKDPQLIIDEIKKSGLRGLGGAGFPTGLKWQFCKDTPHNPKYVIVNADEGNTGAFMDRAILEMDPHSILEGLIIGAYAVGATHGIFYIRQEYPQAIRIIQKAIDDARNRRFLGTNILNSDFSFDVTIHMGAGAFICGEETALISAVEGKRGIPRLRPPFPVTSGLWGKPTVVNNVKTWAAITWIMKFGSKKFRELGTEESPGTIIISLSGKVNSPGLIEVRMGTTLKEIIYDIGGGIKGNKAFKAIQTGGPGGGLLSGEYLQTPVDFTSMNKLGSPLGAGGMIVIDETICIVDFAKHFLYYSAGESCGKCFPCREGTLRLYEILKGITIGTGKLADIKIMKELSHTMLITSLCGLGQAAPNPLVAALRYFEAEFKQHIRDQRCVAGVCKSLKN